MCLIGAEKVGLHKITGCVNYESLIPKNCVCIFNYLPLAFWDSIVFWDMHTKSLNPFEWCECDPNCLQVRGGRRWLPLAKLGVVAIGLHGIALAFIISVCLFLLLYFDSKG